MKAIRLFKQRTISYVTTSLASSLASSSPKASFLSHHQISISLDPGPFLHRKYRLRLRPWEHRPPINCKLLLPKLLLILVAVISETSLHITGGLSSRQGLRRTRRPTPAVDGRSLGLRSSIPSRLIRYPMSGVLHITKIDVGTGVM